MPADVPKAPGSRWRRYHLLALLPAVGMLGGLPFANRVHPLILGLPFLMAYLVAWVVATAALMALVLRLDTVNGLASDGAAGPGAGGATEHGEGDVG